MTILQDVACLLTNCSHVKGFKPSATFTTHTPKMRTRLVALNSPIRRAEYSAKWADAHRFAMFMYLLQTVAI
jgi:hypothetical protein